MKIDRPDIPRIDGAGEALRQLRKRAEMSLGDVANKLGWDKGRLSRYENNKLTLTLSVIEEISKAIGARPELVVLECIKCRYPSLAGQKTKLGRLVAEAIDEIQRKRA